MREARSDLAPPPALRDVTWGPFPVPVQLTVALLAVALLGSVAMVSARPLHMECAGASAECSFETPLSGRRTVAVERAEYGTEWRTQKQGSVRVRVLSLHERGTHRAYRVWESDSELALEQAEYLQRALLGRHESVALRRPAERGLLAIGLLLFVVGACGAAFSLRDLGRIRLRWDPARGALRLTRRVFFLPVSHTTVALPPAPLDVQARFEGLTNSRPTPAQRGWLVAITDAGEVPLLRANRHLAGLTLHDRAARELREVLGCPPRDEATERRERARLDQRLDEVRTQRASWRFGAVWVGLTCGTLLGMLAGWSTAVALRIPNANNEPGYFLPAGIVAGIAACVGLGLYLTSRRRRIR